MLAKITRGNQVTIPKDIVKKAHLVEGDDYVDIQYLKGIICLKPVDIEDRISPEVCERLVRRAFRLEKGDQLVSAREAKTFLKEAGQAVMDFIYKNSYLRAFDSLNKTDQKLMLLVDEEIREFYETGKASYGLRIKKLFSNKEAQVFQARISLSLRVLWAKRSGQVSFLMIGDHGDVIRFLKNI